MMEGADMSWAEEISLVDEMMSEERYEMCKGFEKEEGFWKEEFGNIGDLGCLKGDKG